MDSLPTLTASTIASASITNNRLACAGSFTRLWPQPKPELLSSRNDSSTHIRFPYTRQCLRLAFWSVKSSHGSFLSRFHVATTLAPRQPAFLNTSPSPNHRLPFRGANSRTACSVPSGNRIRVALWSRNT
jgi:hypothetical protein